MAYKNKKEKRISVSVALSHAEREELTEYAKQYGLSMSAFLRLAAKEYIANHKVKEK
jgi:post-segregation antitoxin (ccd killing protein)